MSCAGASQSRRQQQQQQQRQQQGPPIWLARWLYFAITAGAAAARWQLLRATRPYTCRWVVSSWTTLLQMSARLPRQQKLHRGWSAVSASCVVQWLIEDVVRHTLQGGPKLREAQARLAELEAEACRPAGGAAVDASGGWGGIAAARGAAAALRRQKGSQWAKGALTGAKPFAACHVLRPCQHVLPLMSCHHVDAAAWNDLLQLRRLHRV
jgi:hypothetical protein